MAATFDPEKLDPTQFNWFKYLLDTKMQDG